MQWAREKEDTECNVSKGTATKELRELIDEFNILERKGNVGAGTIYVIK